jgi:thiol-disulfide isomerase/thioredoxin
LFGSGGRIEGVKRRPWAFLSVLFVAWVLASGSGVGESQPQLEGIDSAGIENLMKRNPRLVLVPMAAWCLPCREELPALNRMYEKYRGKGLEMVGISVDMGDASAMVPILAKTKVSFPFYWGGERAIRDYNISAIPMLLFVKEGRMVDRVVGKRSEECLDQMIREFLK